MIVCRDRVRSSQAAIAAAEGERSRRLNEELQAKTEEEQKAKEERM